MNVLIKVTKEDIEDGIRCDCDLCPVALAINRIIAKDYFPIIGIASVAIYKTPGWTPVTNLEFNSKIKLFIDKFDNEYSVEPLEFELDIPSECITQEVTNAH